MNARAWFYSQSFNGRIETAKTAVIGDPESCPTCAPDNGKPMWDCRRSDNPQSEDAMPCICLCHQEARR